MIRKGIFFWFIYVLLILVGCMAKTAVSPTQSHVITAAPAANTPIHLQPTTVYLPAITRPPILQTVHPAELNGYVPNINMGWQNTYKSLPRFEETVQYTRFNWNDLNPAAGVYNWSPIENLLQTAQSTNKEAHFRVRNAQPPPWGPGQVLPDWVIAQGVTIVDSGQGTEPLYSDCIFLDAHATFVNALRQQYDGDPDIAFLDIGAYGYFGEWDSEQYSEIPGTLDWHARRRLADMYLGGSATRPCRQANGSTSNVSYTYPGFQQTQLIMPYTPWREDSLFYATDNRADVGIRHDALGSLMHQNQYREEIGDLVQERWLNAPIIFEFSSNSYTPEALAFARAFSREMHATMVHDNLGGQGNDANIESVLEVVGFRLVLDEVIYTREMEPGDPFIVNMSWRNNGSAPPYTYYPLLVTLVDEYGFVVWEHEFTTDVRQWMPNSPIIVAETMVIPPSISTGIYDVRLSFADLYTWTPVLNLAIEGKGSDNRYQIGQVEIKAP
jgi:hypothetical protein